jgi:hypothetical protein
MGYNVAIHSYANTGVDVEAMRKMQMPHLEPEFLRIYANTLETLITDKIEGSGPKMSPETLPQIWREAEDNLLRDAPPELAFATISRRRREWVEANPEHPLSKTYNKYTDFWREGQVPPEWLKLTPFGELCFDVDVQLFKQTKVVACTTAMSYSLRSKGFKLDIIIIDKA